ncbi:MAG: class I SAM-dependent methyltransferase [Rhodobacteraceae bacterium]|nr:class I SAM-dependent methyltransferase [Paracoccaceae bacterium]
MNNSREWTAVPNKFLDARTIRHYDRNAERYAEWSGQDREFAHLDEFITRLPPRGKILDAGCGAGWDSEYFVARGFQALSIDGSRGMVRQANRRNGVQAEWVQFAQLRLHETVDGVWANCSLQHLPRNGFGPALQRICASLKTGGVAAITLHKGSGSRRDSLGRLYCHYLPGEVAEELHRFGMQPVANQSFSGKGFDGTDSELSYMIYVKQLSPVGEAKHPVKPGEIKPDRHTVRC